MRIGLNRETSKPEGYSERGCLLVSYKLPFVRQCHTICHDSCKPLDELEAGAFSLRQAVELSRMTTGTTGSFVYIASGEQSRRRQGWHAHVFIIETRWQKAVVYLFLGLKNLGMCLLPRYWGRQVVPRISARSAPNRRVEKHQFTGQSR